MSEHPDDDDDPLVCHFNATESELRRGATGAMPPAWVDFCRSVLPLLDGPEPGSEAAMTSMPRQKPNRSKQDYCTPPEFLAAVKRRWGIKQFAIDLAATPENAVAPMFYTEAENALVQPWRTKDRELGWLNPPFGTLEPWVAKARKESQIGARLVMLVPAAVGSNWWRDHVHGKAFVLLLNGRLTFVGQPTCYPKDCVLLVYGPDVAPGYDCWSWTKKAA